MTTNDDTNNLRQLHTNDLELGATEAVQQHISRHVVAAKPVSQRKLNFEHSRPRWLREMMAEATGVFFYVFPGIAAITAFTINKEDAGFGSILQVGFAFAIGIAFAIITCAPTSGGHFNPAVTISFAVWQGFPWKKVPYYIFAQIFGERKHVDMLEEARPNLHLRRIHRWFDNGWNVLGTTVCFRGSITSRGQWTCLQRRPRERVVLVPESYAEQSWLPVHD